MASTTRRAHDDDLIQRIRARDAGRDPERLARRHRALCRDPFTFFRGTCHLFYEDWPARTPLDDAPAAWVSGDLHLENFGSFRGDDRLAYFDLNDFDEAALAPVTWELARFATSVVLGMRRLGLDVPEGLGLARRFLDAYRRALADGRARHIERATARGMVRDLLRRVKRRSLRTLLDARVERAGGRQRLIVDGRHALPIEPGARAPLVAALRAVAAERAESRALRVLDCARRVAGTGSLGVRRWVVLVAGDGEPDGRRLLDVKEAHPSSLLAHLALPQPRWHHEAERVVAIQRRAQAVSPALLHSFCVDGTWCVLRELQPSADRLRLDDWGGRLPRLERVLETMGGLVAWSHLRSGGRQGSAIADTLIDFAARSDWPRAVLAHARRYHREVERDWRAFRAAADAGAFALD